MAREQDEKDRKRRALMLRNAKKDIRRVLTNTEGLQRLRAISDDEWQEAVEADAQRESA